MTQFIVNELASGVSIRDFTDSKFKTMRVSMNLIIPLKDATASAGAILPSLVTRATRAYPDMTLLSKRLEELYGATLDSSVAKMGDNQVLSISATGIADRYALDGEHMTRELTGLICSAVFDPIKDAQGLFPEESFRQEKRQLLETIDADFNEKRIYAKARCQELMFRGEPAGIRRYGSRAQVEALTRESLNTIWADILNHARIEIFVLGDCDFNAVCNVFAEHFAVGRDCAPLSSKIIMEPAGVNEVVEPLQVAQSKLVMGLRTGVMIEDSFPTRLMSALFGGSPSSKLFTNVREKMSLCYYCSSNLSIEKGAMFIESGVETENVAKAREAILQQLESIRSGDFTADELVYAKLFMQNSYKGVGDSLYATENWYLQRVFAGEMLTPDAALTQVLEISKEQVVEAAKKTGLDTVYVLKGEAANA